MLNILVQVSNLINGLMVNFLTPAAFGLAQYGEFVGINAIVFLVHRCVTIASEPLVKLSATDALFIQSLALNLLVVVAFILVGTIIDIGSGILLSGMLFNASVMLALQAMRLRIVYVVTMMMICIVFTALVGWSYFHHDSIPIALAMELAVWIPSLPAAVFLFCVGSVVPTISNVSQTLKIAVTNFPQLLTVTAVMNLLTAALPVYLARVLVPYDLGLYRVATSVIQSATSVFPVSTAAVIARFTSHAQGKRLYRTLRSFATLYFSIIATGLILLAYLAPTLTPYLMLCASIPVYYRAVLDERHLIAANRSLWLMAINITVVLIGLGSLFLIHTLENAMLYYACIITAYAGLMQLLRKNILAQLPSLLVIIGCPFAVFLMSREPAFGLFYLALLVLVEWMQDRPTRADLVWLWREM